MKRILATLFVLACAGIVAGVIVLEAQTPIPPPPAVTQWATFDEPVKYLHCCDPGITAHYVYEDVLPLDLGVSVPMGYGAEIFRTLKPGDKILLDEKGDGHLQEFIVERTPAPTATTFYVSRVR
jgi:hypothetical protein